MQQHLHKSCLLYTSRGEGYFAVSLRPLGGCGGDFDSRISRAVRDVSIKTGLSPVIVPMQSGEDRALCERICALSVGSAYTAPFSDTDSIAALFAGAAFTVGMRLHSIIYSACVGTPVLAVSYDPVSYTHLFPLRSNPECITPIC